MRRWLWRIVGYGAAVVVAAVVTTTLFVGAMTGTAGFPANAVSAFSETFLIGLTLTAPFALPGWLICLFVVARRAKAGFSPGAGFFTVSGGLDGFFAINLFLFGGEILSGGATLRFMSVAMPMVVGLNLASIIGGLAGGWAYWWVAERIRSKMS